jgi:hypothetical protein
VAFFLSKGFGFAVGLAASGWNRLRFFLTDANNPTYPPMFANRKTLDFTGGAERGRTADLLNAISGQRVFEGIVP